MQVADPHVAEAEPERVDPEVVRELRVAHGDVAGHALAEAEATEDAQTRRPASACGGSRSSSTVSNVGGPVRLTAFGVSGTPSMLGAAAASGAPEVIGSVRAMTVRLTSGAWDDRRVNRAITPTAIAAPAAGLRPRRR